ncbi:hypothetical protein Tco_0600557 [Tanacetum coccineum]
MHKITPSAHRSPTISASPPVSKKRKQIAGESSSPRKSLKITIKQKQIVEKDDDDSEDRIEPGSHKDNLEVVVDDDDKERETKDDRMGRALRRMCRRQGYMIQDIERKCVTTAKFWETHNKIDDILHEVVPQISENEFKVHAPAIIAELFKNPVESNVIHVHPTITTSTETESSADLQYQLYLKMKRNLQDRANNIALWEALRRGEKSEKEQNDKKNKVCKGFYVKAFKKRLHNICIQTQSQHQEWDAWEEENVVDEDEVISKDVTPELIAEF